MAENVKVCELDQSVKEKLKKFRFRKEKNNAAIVLKVEKENQMIVLDDEYEDCSLEDLQEELPAAQPRFIVYSYQYNHDDGRTSFPLVFIFISPQGCKPEQQMMYAGSMKSLVDEIQVTKVFDLRSIEDMTEEWLQEKLKFFR